MALFPERKPTGNFWHDHSLSIILIIMMVVQTALALIDGAVVFNREQPMGPEHYAWQDWSWLSPWWAWWRFEYNVSLVADTFGVLLVVLLTKRLRERDSAESK